MFVMKLQFKDYNNWDQKMHCFTSSTRDPEILIEEFIMFMAAEIFTNIRFKLTSSQIGNEQIKIIQ